MKKLVISSFACVRAFYLPGVAPLEYEVGSKVDVKVNKLYSSKTQLPYQFYTLPICKPIDAAYKHENLGEILKGDEIMDSPYEVCFQHQMTKPNIKNTHERVQLI